MLMEITREVSVIFTEPLSWLMSFTVNLIFIMILIKLTQSFLDEQHII